MKLLQNKSKLIHIIRTGLVLVLLSSCGSFRFPFSGKEKNDLLGFSEMSPKDYSDHLASLQKSFLSTPGINTAKIPRASSAYLNWLADQIIGKNEIFFKNLKSASVTVLDMPFPLHFSLPKGEIFLTKGLLGKYIKHESMLVSVLAYELVRSEKLLYPKQTLVPVGYTTLDRMITLNRLHIDEKMEVHKWAYHITIRSGYDGDYYLSWLQIQNRNTADFILQVGDVNQINREESLFKAFLIKHGNNDNIVVNKNSSKNFYGLLNGVRDASL